jgi:aspartyl aminopeptidase
MLQRWRYLNNIRVISKKTFSMSSFSSMESEKSAYTTGFLNFLNESCTAYHATRAAKNLLLAAGFVEINEKEEWSVLKGGNYFFTRNGTCLIAFSVGEKYEAGNGFCIAAAHTDSPNLRLKAVPTVKKSNCLMLNTQPYGGGLWHTWFDRDLGIAGRVVRCIATATTTTTTTITTTALFD